MSDKGYSLEDSVTILNVGGEKYVRADFAIRQQGEIDELEAQIDWWESENKYLKQKLKALEEENEILRDAVESISKMGNLSSEATTGVRVAIDLLEARGIARIALEKVGKE